MARAYQPSTPKIYRRAGWVAGAGEYEEISIPHSSIAQDNYAIEIQTRPYNIFESSQYTSSWLGVKLDGSARFTLERHSFTLNLEGKRTGTRMKALAVTKPVINWSNGSVSLTDKELRDIGIAGHLRLMELVGSLMQFQHSKKGWRRL